MTIKYKHQLKFQTMITTVSKRNELKPKSFSCTDYGELTFYGNQEKDLTKKDYKELKNWCKNISSSLIYIWIDKKHMSYNTSKIIMQLFFDLEKYQRTSKVVVQWRIDNTNMELLQTAESFKNLFPQVSFILQRD